MGEDEIESWLRGDDGEMNMAGRDPWTIAAVLLNILATICGVAWVSGKTDQRLATAERDISILQAKADKDGQQDVQIATISTQLSAISVGVGEIKAKLEAAKNDRR
jgi:hypothetical protein